MYLETFGCAHNISDGEYMKGLLTEYGYEMVSKDKKSNAAIWVINSCTVKDPSQAAFMRLVDEGKQTGKGVVVTGCVPQADRTLKGLEEVSMLGVTQIEKIVSVVEETAKGNVVKLLKKNPTLPRLDLPKIRKSRLVEIIPISTGCLGSCTYCKTKHARGKLGSYSIQVLSERLRTVLQSEVTEVWLASEDTGAYGIDLSTNISTLLRTLTTVMEANGNYPAQGIHKMLRIGMTNPPYILAHLDVVAECLNHPNVFKFLHIPVQSGSNSVLNDMRREYTVEEFKRVCDYLLKYVPHVTIATDIICGFPGETEEDFEQTMKLVEAYKFPVLNISKFYARPGTPAAKMKKVKTDIAKARSTRLTRFFESYSCYGFLVGQTVDVWFSEEVSFSKQSKGSSNPTQPTASDQVAEKRKQSVGHTKEYIKVVVQYEAGVAGLKKRVQILSASKFHVSGKLAD